MADRFAVRVFVLVAVLGLLWSAARAEENIPLHVVEEDVRLSLRCTTEWTWFSGKNQRSYARPSIGSDVLHFHFSRLPTALYEVHSLQVGVTNECDTGSHEVFVTGGFIEVFCKDNRPEDVGLIHLSIDRYTGRYSRWAANRLSGRDYATRDYGWCKKTAERKF